ncbi:MAG: rhomboid family intramembrane serine protease [Candidatus Hadarchaeia archaeon]
MVAVYVAQVLLYSIGGINLYSQVISYFAPTKANFITRPWTLVTSIFLHDVSNPLHILVNSLFLFFVGQALERRVGRKRLLYLFFGGGILASIAQIPLLPEGFVLIGASGAVFAVIGGLTAISPKMPIFLFFLLPIPLWMFAVGYGIHELAQALIGDGNVAHMAHFAGLLIGAGYGYKLRKDFGKKFGRSRSPFTF